jgi:hypothetical protein
MKKLSIPISFRRNALCKDSLNFVFNAHNIIDNRVLNEYRYVVINLEQMQSPPMLANHKYLDLLQNSIVFDYSIENQSHYCVNPNPHKVVEFGFAPYLHAVSSNRIQSNQGIFYGFMNDQRRKIITNLNNSGVSISVLSPPLYGPERDLMLQNYGFILNIPFYSKPIFEQARLFHPMSMGIPTVADKSLYEKIPSAYQDTVIWFESDNIESLTKIISDEQKFQMIGKERIANFKNQYLETEQIDKWKERLHLVTEELDRKSHAYVSKFYHKAPLIEPNQTSHLTLFAESLTRSFYDLCCALAKNSKIYLFCSLCELFIGLSCRVLREPARILYFSKDNSYLVEITTEFNRWDSSACSIGYSSSCELQIVSVVKTATTLYDKNLSRTFCYDLGLQSHIDF